MTLIIYYDRGLSEESLMPVPRATSPNPAAKPDGRRQRSQRTRAKVVEAARPLFVERGYLATTIEAVADAAEVAVQTVYYLFTNKRTLLAGVLDASIAGDTEPVAVLDRNWFDELSTARAEDAIAHLVEAAVGIVSRAAPVYEVVRRASADPEVAALLADNRARRRADQRSLVQALADAGHLCHDLTVRAAADQMYALLNEETFQMLTVDCHWSTSAYRTWATDLLTHQLVGDEGPPGPRRGFVP
jgi:AcrR family transcriptional regulator